MQTPKQILKKYWGFDDFRNPQEEIITSVLNNTDVIALLPTGGGKSICFQVPALLKDGVCIVISPLIALMEDQVKGLKEKNIKATTITSGLSEDEIITLFDTIRFGNYKFLYISPERLQSKFIQQKIAQLNVNLIAIDEAHCISEWGHDFRPAYKNISILKELQPNVNIIALTATATPKVIEDIQNSLTIPQAKVFKKSFTRNNLAYQIYFTEDKLQRLQQIFTKTKGSAIVYVNKRSKTKEISSFLNANGFSSSFYHAGLSSIEKKIAFENWMSEKTPIMVATNAFGMGIDKANVKIVVHYNLPNSIENYIQEAGRAGRDGNKAFAVLLTNPNDIAVKQDLDKNSTPSIEEIKFIHQKLYQYYQIAKGQLVEDVFNFNLLDFCNRYETPANKTFSALQILNNNSIISFNTSGHQKSTFRFLVSSKQVLTYKESNAKMSLFIENLLRIYQAFTDKLVKVDEFFVGKKTGITSYQAIQNLEKLDNDGIIEYSKSSNDAQLTFLTPREDDKTINRIQKNIKSYLEQKKQKTKALISFIENNTVCRNIQLLTYFEEDNPEKCGMCDVCINDRKNSVINIENQILKILKNQEVSVQQICEMLHQKPEAILINLRNLLAEEKIGLTVTNTYYLK